MQTASTFACHMSKVLKCQQCYVSELVSSDSLVQQTLPTDIQARRTTKKTRTDLVHECGLDDECRSASAATEDLWL